MLRRVAGTDLEAMLTEAMDLSDAWVEAGCALAAPRLAAERRALVASVRTSERIGEPSGSSGAARTAVQAIALGLLNALRLTNPRAVTEPNAHLDRDIPRRAVYAKLWEEVKAA